MSTGQPLDTKLESHRQMTKRNRQTPAWMYRAVEERSWNGEYYQCEYEGCTARAEQMHHTKLRGMGGTTVHSTEDIEYICAAHHRHNHGLR